LLIFYKILIVNKIKIFNEKFTLNILPNVRSNRNFFVNLLILLIHKSVHPNSDNNERHKI